MVLPGTKRKDDLSCMRSGTKTQMSARGCSPCLLGSDSGLGLRVQPLPVTEIKLKPPLKMGVPD